MSASQHEINNPQHLHESLKKQAEQAASRAYAPYSGFPVGAAVLDDQGRIFAGANVENASLGLTICAERVAVAAAVTAGARRLRAVAIYTPTAQLTPPCGACRQVLAEFGANMEIHLFDRAGHHRRYVLGELLPKTFDFDPPNNPPRD